MTDSYEREGFSGLLGGHKIEKAAHGGATPLTAFSDPVDGHADPRAAHHGQIEGGDAMAHAAAVFAGDHIQAQVEARFDAPMAAVGFQHLPGAERGGRARAEQIFGFDLFGGILVAVNTTGQPGGLLHKGEDDGGGGGVPGPEAAGLGATAVASKSKCRSSLFKLWCFLFAPSENSRLN